MPQRYHAEARAAVVIRRLCLAALAASVLGLGADRLHKAKGPAASAVTSPILFENRQKSSGVPFVLLNGTTDEKPILDSVLGGVALLDFDNDGWTDLYVTGFDRNILYHNNGDGTFTDVTAHAGVGGQDASARKLWSVGAAWVDYDNDGRLDLFVTNYLDWSLANTRVCGDPGKRLSCTPSYFQGLPNLLYHNNGDGTFTELSASTGIAPQIGKGMSVAIADYDDDGFMDIFVANDNERNFLFHNQQGRGFVEVGVESAVAFTEDGVPVSSMGADFRDLNNDGRPDLIVTALEGETFPVYINEGRGFFSASSYQTGIGFVSRRMSGWGVGAYDFNNDGRKDVFVANSHVSENVGLYGNHHYRQPNAVFLNTGKTTFRDVTAQAGPAMRVPAAHRGTAFGDLNNDGKVDAVVSVIGGPAEILYNTSAGGGHWILIQTEGKQSNRDGIGTRIKLTGESGLVQYNHVTTATGYASSSDRRVHFGLGADSRIREIELRWPSGKVQLLRDVPADQILKVTEP